MSAQPGPWTASEMRMTAKDWASLNGDHDLTIVRTNWDGFHGDVVAAVWCDNDHDEMATAHVIAAAPDMLRSLEQIKMWLEKLQPALNHIAKEVLGDIIRDQIDPAIAKARGAA